MSDKPATRSIDLDIAIDTPLDAAWKALTTPEEVARWFPPISSGSASAPGDKLLISWGKQMEWWTTVTEIEAMSHIRWVDHPGMAVDWHLETRDGKTVVRIVNSGWGTDAEWDDQFVATEAGWRYFLFNLKHYLERHRGTPRVMIVQQKKTPVERETQWTRLLGADGLRLERGDTPTITFGSATYRVAIEREELPRTMWLRIPELAEALLFVEFAPEHEGAFHVALWLSTYGLDDGTITALRASMRELADRVFV